MRLRFSVHGLLLTFLLALLTWPPTSEAAQGQPASVLSTKVESLTLQDATMEDALRALRATNQTQILIGFETVPHHPDEPMKKVSLAFSNATVAQVLDTLCSQNPRYTYELIHGLLIHVHPLHSDSNLPNLLDIRISDFSVEGSMLPAAVIVQIAELAPELSSYVTKMQSEYYKSRGLEPSSPGVTMHGNMEPQIKLHLQNVTVRQILNAVVIYSYELNRSTKPDWTGNKLTPTSWIYDFTIDPAATTGLGGYPRWTAF